MATTSNKQALLLVSGHVQGVFFRAHAQEEATRLDLTGYARNLPDGRVEILLQGAEAKIQMFIQWIESLGRDAKNGFLKAKVDQINTVWQPITKNLKNFEVF
ncbi:acylphosphatase [Candidatus Peregrinibacteria bacterium]|nr:acylphosphatase [Candidatus Peregrinibacteria bacterium]